MSKHSICIARSVLSPTTLALPFRKVILGVDVCNIRFQFDREGNFFMKLKESVVNAVLQTGEFLTLTATQEIRVFFLSP